MYKSIMSMNRSVVKSQAEGFKFSAALRSSGGLFQHKSCLTIFQGCFCVVAEKSITSG